MNNSNRHDDHDVDLQQQLPVRQFPSKRILPPINIAPIDDVQLNEIDQSIVIPRALIADAISMSVLRSLRFNFQRYDENSSGIILSTAALHVINKVLKLKLSHRNHWIDMLKAFAIDPSTQPSTSSSAAPPSSFAINYERLLRYLARMHGDRGNGPVIDELISNQLLMLPPSTTRRLSGVADDMFASRRSAKLITDIEQCIRRFAIDHPIDIDRMRLGGEYRSMIDTRTFLELIADQKLDVVLESLMHRLLAEFQNSQAMIDFDRFLNTLKRAIPVGWQIIDQNKPAVVAHAAEMTPIQTLDEKIQEREAHFRQVLFG